MSSTAEEAADPLTEPLLSNTTTTTISSSTSDNTTSRIMVDFPKEDVPLLVPPEWLPSCSDDDGEQPQTCSFQYDADRNLLKLVTSSNGVVLDVIDPEDIIGVTVEIKLNASAAALEGESSAIRATTTSNDENDNDRPSNAPATDTPTDTQSNASLVIYAYPRQDPKHVSSNAGILARFCGLGKIHPKPNPNYKRPVGEEWRQWGPRYAFHRRFQVVASEDVGALNALVKAIKQAADILPLQENRGRMLVVINPKSGPKCNAEEIYENSVNILLEQAGIDHDICVTNHPYHAKERVAKHATTDDEEKDISEYTAIVCMGGDGIVHEVLQGIQERPDAQDIMKKISIGILGCGTSNGMAKSIAEESQQSSSIVDAAFLIAKGKTKDTDLSLYNTASKSYWSFLTFSWSMLADIDIDSELVRFLGPFRFDIWGLWCTIKMKKYRAKFSYLPGKHSKVNMPNSLSDQVPGDWVTEEDEFLVFWASHVSHAAEKTHNSPMSRLDDGVFHILVVR